MKPKRLSKIQKRAVRAITLSKHNAHSEPLLKLVKLLSVTDLFNLNSLKFFYNYKHNRVPEYFQQYDFQPNEEIHTYPTRQGVTQKCLWNDISKIINATLAYLLDRIWTHSLHGFSANAKKKPSLVDIPNYAQLLIAISVISPKWRKYISLYI